MLTRIQNHLRFNLAQNLSFNVTQNAPWTPLALYDIFLIGFMLLYFSRGIIKFIGGENKEPFEMLYLDRLTNIF